MPSHDFPAVDQSPQSCLLGAAGWGGGARVNAACHLGVPRRTQGSPSPDPPNPHSELRSSAGACSGLCGRNPPSHLLADSAEPRPLEGSSRCKHDRLRRPQRHTPPTTPSCLLSMLTQRHGLGDPVCSLVSTGCSESLAPRCRWGGVCQHRHLGLLPCDLLPCPQCLWAPRATSSHRPWAPFIYFSVKPVPHCVWCSTVVHGMNQRSGVSKTKVIEDLLLHVLLPSPHCCP